MPLFKIDIAKKKKKKTPKKQNRYSNAFLLDSQVSSLVLGLKES